MPFVLFLVILFHSENLSPIEFNNFLDEKYFMPFYSFPGSQFMIK